MCEGGSLVHVSRAMHGGSCCWVPVMGVADEKMCVMSGNRLICIPRGQN